MSSSTLRAICLIGALILIAVVARQTSFAQQSTEPVAKLQKARSLLAQQRAPEAEAILRDVIRDHSDQPGPHYLLGLALHQQKKYDDAILWYRKAAEFKPTKAIALYNMACIHSLQGNNDAAFEQLEQSLAAGFNNFGQLEGDPDFANIRSDPRFQQLLPRQLPDDELFLEPTRIIHQFVGEASGDQFGWTARRVGDWDGDGVVDFVSTAPTHNQGAGKVYVYSSKTGELLLEKSGAAGEQFGNSASGCGDVNGDGVPDLAVGAPNQKQPGNAYVFSGVDGKQLLHISGASPGDRFGVEVSELGDIDGDGCGDFLVGSDAGNGKQARSGLAIAYSGKTGQKLFELEGEQSGDNFGNAAACQPNGDGSFTLAIGAQNAGPNDRGRVYLYRIEGGTPRSTATIEGDDNSVNLGQMFISFPGDVNGDGVHDVYASDFSDKSSAPGGGKIYVCDATNGQPLLTLTGKQPGEGLGTSPSDAGDVNGDGVGDLVIGAWQNREGAPSGGKVYLYDGRTGDLIRTWTCRQAGDTLGFDACGIGDVDGDGKIDFLLTSAWSNIRGPKTGRVFILAGE